MFTKTDRLRISYSLLSLWERGQTDLATALYLHQEMPTTKAMADGKIIHQKIEEHLLEHHQLPDFLGANLPLIAPQPEEKIVAPYNDRWDLSGIVDCLDNDFFLEFKTGTTPAFYYAKKYQIPFYFLLLDLNKTPRKKAFLIKYNQHNQTSEVILFWKNKIAEVRNYIDTLAPEIEEFFIEKGIIS